MQRSPEPDFVADLRRSQTEWSSLDGPGRYRIRQALSQDFRGICAYCERYCQPVTGTGNSTDEETIDHFRPRSRFPEQRFVWLNLMYSCRRCNCVKDDSWPGFGNAVTEALMPASEYVNPNAMSGNCPADGYFSYSFETGEMTSADGLSPSERATALRTIRDIDLNDSSLGENDPSHLWNRRLRQLQQLIQGLNTMEDFDSQVRMMLEFMLPDKPFSGFIAAYLMGRFPALALILGRT